MKHLGDITKMTPSCTDPVDCVTFGSPCQDLSIAGKRAGLAGERSGLFMEAVRVIKDMRLNTFGAYPTFAVWENVPGAFSSNKGEDFHAVLEELAHIVEPEVSIPRPENGKWAKAGFVSGNGWSLAWRTFDAQFWGVPQRRRRIALVVDFGGQRAGEILFERTSMRWDTETSIPAWKGIARDPANCPAGHDRVAEGAGECLTTWDVQSRRIYEASGKWPAIYAGEGGGHGYVISMQGNMIDRDVKQNGSGVSESETMYSLTSTDRHGVAIPINTQIATRHISLGERTGMGWGEDGDPAYTLQAGHEHAVCCLLNNQGGQRIQVEDGRVSSTLRAESHAHEPVICAAFTAGQGAKANGIGYAEEQAPTLRTDGGLSAMPTVLCRAHGQANAETLDDCCPTLNCNHEQPIVFESHSQDARYTQQGDTSPACTAQCGTGGNNMPLVAFAQNQMDEVRDLHGVAGALAAETGMKQQTHIAQSALTPWDNQARRVYSDEGNFPALSAREHAGQNQQAVLHKTPLRWIVRRLTPTECERLQGFPDGWTDIGEWVDAKGKRHKPADSPRYKALGNSIALPQWWWITCKMARYLPEKPTLGSLFDGIGGFPLVWETKHGKGTAVWASEIEEFPIAVTKMRFGEEAQ